MPGAHGNAQRLGELLQDHRQRCGRTYEQLARKTFVSKSSLHRYCSGKSVPREFALVERIARACDVDQCDLDELYRCWAEAVRAEDHAHSSVLVDPIPASSPASNPKLTNSTGGGRGRRSLVVVASVVAVAVLMFSLAASVNAPDLLTDQAGSQKISGPTWVLDPQPVSPRLFGATINSSTGAMPAFKLGAVRFWDSGTRWSQIEQRHGEFDWTVLDRLVTAAQAADLPALFVIGGTPPWAAPDAPPMPYEDGARAAGPDNPAVWDAFVTALVSRYRGRIEAYELWVLANDRRFYQDDLESLVEMTRRGQQIIKSVDPTATVVCPGMGRLWDPDGVQVLEKFAKLGGYRYCDAASVKLYQRTAADPPETMVELISTIDRAMHKAEVHPVLWSTGTTYDIPLETPLSHEQATNYAMRFFMVGLIGTKVNLRRMYFYNWGGTKIPIVLQAIEGAPTEAALAVEQLQRWLAHARIRSCGHGSALRLPENVWQCEFVVDGNLSIIQWTSTGIASLTVDSRVVAVERADGSITRVRPGDALEITERPILIRTSARP